MGIIETLKDTISVIQKADNLDLYKRMLELQTQVFALVEENRTLHERLAMKEKLSFRDNYYWIGDEGPYCSPCWDGAGKLVRIHKKKGYNPICPNCKTMVEEGGGFTFDVG